jgi:alpha-D-ribose 1-methylphosphonate 5-triphosphate synthase subunit PhnH
MPHDIAPLDASLDGGFGQPVFEAQAIFRLLMNAMARPGSHHFVEADVTAPGLAGSAQAALALTLCDADTPVWCRHAPAALGAWLAFHAGARLTASPDEAAFAFVEPDGALPDGLPLGTQDYPDRSATLVIEVRGFGEGERFRLTGPGIDVSCNLAVAGLPAGFVAFRAANRARFPRGLDVVLTAGRDLVALPRSTHFLPSEG